MSDAAPVKAGARADPGPGRDAERSFIKAFPCVSCGARLTFAPGTRHLACEFCGAENRIAEQDARIEELDLEVYLKALQDSDGPYAPESAKCQRCGLEQQLPPNHFAAPCTHCGGPIVSRGYAGRKIKPKAVVPFQVGRERAQEAFRQWVGRLRVAPDGLRRFAQSDAALTGSYLPFWTFDCRTHTDWRGDRGTNHYEYERSRTAALQGKRLVRTDWELRTGHAEVLHDDVLVLASGSLPPELRGAAREWNLKQLVPYQPEFVSGYSAEAYELGLADGFARARETIDADVQTAIRRQIGGDQQRVGVVETRYEAVKFRHVLLPVWRSAYRYRNKTYRFLVNGQTGEIAGDSPMEFFNKAWLIAGAILAFFVLVALFSL